MRIDLRPLTEADLGWVLASPASDRLMSEVPAPTTPLIHAAAPATATAAVPPRVR